MNISALYSKKLIHDSFVKVYNEMLEVHWQSLKLRIETETVSTDLGEQAVLTAKVYTNEDKDITDIIPKEGFRWDLHFDKKEYDKIITGKNTITIEPGMGDKGVKVSFALTKVRRDFSEFSKNGHREDKISYL